MDFLKFISNFIPINVVVYFNFVSIYDQELFRNCKFFYKFNSKFLFSLFIIFAYFFSSLSISEVFEDYIAE